MPIRDGNDYPLHSAIRSLVNAEDNITSVELEILLKKHVDRGINVRDTEGETLLLLAVQNEVCFIALINLLLEHGADVKATSPRDGNTALHWLAMRKKTIELWYTAAFMLLKNGADVNARNLEGCTPLHMAAKTEAAFSPIVTLLLEHGGDANARNLKGETPLHLYLQQKKFSLVYVRDLLKKTSDVNVVNSNGETLLHVAVQNEKCTKQLIELLLERGADVKAQSRDGNTPLHLLAMDCKYGKENKYYYLYENIVRNREGIDEILLQRGSDVDARNSEGCTPLHLAVQSEEGHSMIDVLLKHEADANARNFNGDTPLHLYLRNKKFDFEYFRRLLKETRDVNVVNCKGETPLHLAVRDKRCDFFLIKLILDQGADVGIKDASGENALVAYCHAVHRDNGRAHPMLQMLLQGPEARKLHAKSSLHAACLFHDVDSVRRLLKLGANVNAADSFGHSPLTYAIFTSGGVEKCSPTLKLMLDYGARVDHLVILRKGRRRTAIWDKVRELGLDTYSDRCSLLEIGVVSSDFEDKHDNRSVVSSIVFQHATKLLKLQRQKFEKGINVVLLKTYDRDFLTALGASSDKAEEYKDLLHRCSEELRMMSETKVGEKVSFWDLMIAKPEEMAIYAKNKELVKAFNDKKYTFPMYQGMLDAKIDKALERGKLMESAAVLLSNALKFGDSRNRFLERILCYCSNRDLLNAIDGLDETVDEVNNEARIGIGYQEGYRKKPLPTALEVYQEDMLKMKI